MARRIQIGSVFAALLAVVAACEKSSTDVSSNISEIIVSAPSETVLVGAQLQLSATLNDSNGNPLTGPTISWSSSDSTVASISESGLLLGHRPGPVTVSAMSDGVTGSSDFIVTWEVVSLDVGGHTCAVTADGDAFCWGNGSNGEIGNGRQDQQQLVPAKVSGGLEFRSVSVDIHHSCGVTLEGHAYCWGRG